MRPFEAIFSKKNIRPKLDMIQTTTCSATVSNILLAWNAQLLCKGKYHCTKLIQMNLVGTIQTSQTGSQLYID